MESSLVVRHADVEIDVRHELVRRNGVPQHLRQKSIRVLFHLIENRDRPISKQELLSAVWNDVTVTDDTLVQSIVEIRKALGDEARDAQFVRTVPRRGYQFVAPVVDPIVAPEVAPVESSDARPTPPPPRPASNQRLHIVLAATLFVAVASSLGGILFRERVATARGSESPRLTHEMTGAMTGDLEAYRLYLQGVERTEALDNPKAIALFEQAIARDPDFAMAHARIGYAYGVTWSQLDRARPHLDRALQLGDRLSEKDRLHVEAWRAIVDRQFPSAIELFRGIIARYPTDLEAYLRTGQLLSGEEQLADAAAVLERGLAVDSASPGLHNALGQVYLFLGRKDDAIAAHRRYVALAPAEPNAHDSLGITWQAIGEYDKALSEYETALRLNPRFDIARVHLANTYFQMGRRRDAVQEFERYIEGAPSDIERARGYTALSDIQRSRGNLQGATELAQRAMIFPSIGRDTLYRLALDRGDLATARTLQAQIESKRSGRGARATMRVTHYLRGHEALKTDQSEQAIEHFRQALRYQPPYYTADTMEDCLADAYRTLGRHAEAAREYERILRFNPNHAPARFHLAQTLSALGRREDALREYRRFLETWKHADRDLPEVIEARRVVGPPS